jgi:hypothetical protein
MSLLKYCSRICLGLLLAVSALAGEGEEVAPLTLEQVDRAQDLYLDGIQQRIVAVSAKPSVVELKELSQSIKHAKVADSSPFSPGFRHYHVEGSSMVAKTEKPKSSVERQAEQNVDDAFARSLKYVAEAQKAVESGNARMVILRLSGASKEVAKVGAVLDLLRKRRSAQPLAGKAQQPAAATSRHQDASLPAKK